MYTKRIFGNQNRLEKNLLKVNDHENYSKEAFSSVRSTAPYQKSGTIPERANSLFGKVVVGFTSGNNTQEQIPRNDGFFCTPWKGKAFTYTPSG